MFKKSGTYHIIGGGLAGLCTAKNIKEKYPHSKVIIYEAAAHLGGRCFSYFDKTLQRNLDNATHVLLGANRQTLKLMQQKSFSSKAFFIKDKQIHQKFWQEISLILLSIFNTKPQEIAKSLLLSLACKLFPFLSFQRKIYFSKGDLTSNLITPLSHYADEIRCGWILQNFKAENNQIKQLIFNQGLVDITAQDKVISALDAYNYHKLFNGPKFDFNPITNIFYRTSVPLTLPQNIPLLGFSQATADWVFINKDIVGVTISNFKVSSAQKDELARRCWKEIRQVNGLCAAFLPPYKVVTHHRATLRQNKKNQALRPNSPQTEYKNLYLVGDWTMQNYPCCMEAAVCSALRTIKCI